MKKIALMIAIALVLSVGGVYATWRYSTAAVGSSEFDISDKLSITIVDQTNDSKGSISAPNSLVLTIDDDNGDHKPDWDADIAEQVGSLVVKFTPNVGASATSFKYYLTISSYEYDCASHGHVSIFNPVDTDATVDGIQILSGTIDFTGGKDAVSSNTYTAEDIQNLLVLNRDIELDSIEEYNTYSEHVGNVKLVLTVTEITA